MKNKTISFEKVKKQFFTEKPHLKERYEAMQAMDSVIQILVHFRNISGFTQADMAKKTNTSQPAIARFESGLSVPNLSTIQKYAKAIGYMAVVSIIPSKQRAKK